MIRIAPSSVEQIRSILGNIVWKDDSVFKLYFFCQMKASRNRYIWNGVQINPGDLPISERHCAQVLNWSRNKLIRKLDALEKTGLVTVSKCSDGTLITLKDWVQATDNTGDKTRPEWFQNETSTGAISAPGRYQFDAISGTDMEPERCHYDATSGSNMSPNRILNNQYTYSPGVMSDFNRLWLSYPATRRTKKNEAIELYRRAIAAGATIDAMLLALNSDKASSSWTENGQRYVPGICSWLQRESWRDYLDTPESEEEAWLKHQ